MPETLSTARADLRDRLNELSAAFWPDASLNNYLNEGCRVIARKAKCLQEKKGIPVQALNQTYQAPTDVYRIHRAEYLPEGSDNTYPLELRNYAEMDSIWGSNQTVEQYYPSFLATWREPPNMTLVLFPVPSSAGNLNIFYYRVAATATLDTQNLDCPEGWWDLVIMYATYTALFKALDPRWKELRDQFNSELGDLVDAAQGYSDAVARMTPPSGIGPLWQFGGGMDQGWY